MKKFLSLFFIIFLWSNSAFTDHCGHDIDSSWTYDSKEAIFEFKSRSAKTLYITKIQIVTKNGGLMKEKKDDRWGYVIKINPYGVRKTSMSISSLNPDLIPSSTSQWWCTDSKPKEATKRETERNKKNKKSWFKWWYILVGIFILGIIGYILEEMDKGKNNKTKSNEKTRSITRKASSPLAEGENFIFDVFEGKKPLVQTFWFVFIILNFIISFISGLAAEGLDNNFFLIGAVVSNVWAGIGTWNSATNYQLEKIKKQEPYGWSYAAKILVVLNFISVAGQTILLING